MKNEWKKEWEQLGELGVTKAEIAKIKKMSKDAKEKCICRTERVLMSACTYLVVYFRGRDKMPQDIICEVFKCTTASLRDCAKELAKKGVVDL